jgi:antitoxin component HigA of HigAB toxin-antitoxin module
VCDPIALVACFGNKSRVSEVLNKKRRLTLDMIRNLNQQLNISFENLLGGVLALLLEEKMDRIT